MVATNHALTGAIIGLTVSNPIIAVVVAFFSHFVLDVIPHFGMGKSFVKTRAFKVMLVVDALLCFGLVVLLFAYHSSYWLVPALTAFVSTSPDLWSFKRFVMENKGKVYQPGLFARFASRIQWFERPVGGAVELAWFTAATYVLIKII